MRAPADHDPAAYCQRGTKCHSVTSSRPQVIGPRGDCSSCVAHASLADLEALCSADDADPLDELYLSLIRDEDKVAERIEARWKVLPEIERHERNLRFFMRGENV